VVKWALFDDSLFWNRERLLFLLLAENDEGEEVCEYVSIILILFIFTSLSLGFIRVAR
jgi:hypothetical protein